MVLVGYFSHLSQKCSQKKLSLLRAEKHHYSITWSKVRQWKRNGNVKDSVKLSKSKMCWLYSIRKLQKTHICRNYISAHAFIKW